jgi:hypothetical protein
MRTPTTRRPEPATKLRGGKRQRSSSLIAALATALAKARGELVNAEKSLVGTIETGGGVRRAQAFRYAPLSTDLEIVRNPLTRRGGAYRR